jgi:hypothetical protein
MLPLAFSVHSGPGVYALLLGSGVARAADIPTGWDVTLDLISQLASVTKKAEEAEGEPASWFRNTYGEEPDYSRVIDHLSATPADRQRLLEGYFEPTEEEREEGKKTPTAAHRAIAKLARKGYVRVIITTNFDKLMERALDAEGLTPNIISTPDAAEGAPPTQHVDCTVVKVHGDYLDARIKNTPTELSAYDHRTDALLDKVFGEYGLIVCGWSAEYDTALREAFKRARTRRYGTYWVHVGEPGEAARELVNFAGGQCVKTEGADTFFEELLEKVEALEDYGGRHPLTAPMAVATVKRFLAEDRHRIRLEDLVRDEVERVYDGLFVPELYSPGESGVPTEVDFSTRVERYRRLTEVLLVVMITGCYWDERERTIWSYALERLANSYKIQAVSAMQQMRCYPALLLLYGGGIAAVAGEKYKTLANLLYRARVRESSNEYPSALGIAPNRFYDAAEWMNKHLQPDTAPEKRTRNYYPMSEHLHAALRNPLREILPDPVDYDRTFDRFEYLLGIAYVDQLKQHKPDNTGPEGYGPVGRFGPRLYGRPDVRRVLETVEQEAVDLTTSWPPLQDGLFGGSYDRFREAKDAYDDYISEEPWRRRF